MLSPDLQRIEHIRDYCLDIEDTVLRFGNSYDVFCKDIDFQHSIAFSVLQIGEISGKLSGDYRLATADSVQWHLIRGLRNIVVHDYGSIKLDELWKIILNDIPALKTFCEEQLAGAEPEDAP